MIKNESIKIFTGNSLIKGNLYYPEQGTKMVIFAHGSGSSMNSTRNKYVAEILNKQGIGTLLVNLLTTQEALLDKYTSQFRFNIPLLAERVKSTAEWLRNNYQVSAIGCFGSSTGATAALVAAAKNPELFQALVCRGGRPDLAFSYLNKIKSPTLLIVGSLDEHVLALNRSAFSQLNCYKKLEVVYGATHLFEESGKMEEVAALAKNWFSQNLGSSINKNELTTGKKIKFV